MVVRFVIMQKLINVLAVISFGVSGAVVAGGVYVYTNQDAIKDNIKNQIEAAVGESILGPLNSSQIGSVLINGPADEVDVTDEALGADTALPIPSIPF